MCALPLLLICCRPKTVLFIVIFSYSLRCNFSVIMSWLKEILKWLLPFGSSLSLATLLAPTGEEMLLLGIFAYAYAAQLLVIALSDLLRFNPTAR